jgi:hypothetical protein
MVLKRFLIVISFVFTLVFAGFAQIIRFETLDRSNALNQDYHDFKWATWKVAVAFADPVVTRDSLNVQGRIFKDIYPGKPFYDFLIEEITHTWTRKSQFRSFEWYQIPLKKEMQTFEYKDKLYYVSIPDSSLEIFRNTGCRFALLLQKFSPDLTLCGMKNILLMYQKTAPTAIENRNFGNSCMRFSFSFSYVIYDLMEDRVVQFGNAFDDNKSKKVTVDEIKRCLNCAIMDVLQVSPFYYK